MRDDETGVEPDWDEPLSISLTPAAMVHALFGSAEAVHTGWDSCIDPALTVADITALEDESGNHCRLVKQEYVEDEAPDTTWHDWAVELKIGDAYVTAHWQAQDTAGPSAWEWCASEAEKAFAGACVLVGKRARRGIVIEEPPHAPRPARTHH